MVYGATHHNPHQMCIYFILILLIVIGIACVRDCGVSVACGWRVVGHETESGHDMEEDGERWLHCVAATRRDPVSMRTCL